MDDALPFVIGTVVEGRYKVVALLGQGGMGAVYRAEQLSLQREVALKVLRADLAGAEAAARFSREALALSKLDHPNIVRVIDSGQAEGRPYLVMELVTGRDLQGELYRGPLSPERAVPILAALCDALAAAHAQGIIHRDLKPENVILTEQGVPKILDFGIAVAADGSQRVTQAGFVLGTPEYLAPEQAMGQVLTARSDLYTLGVMAYRMLSGVLPFTAAEPREYLLLHAGTLPPDLREKWPAGAKWPELCDVVMRALAKDPEKRWPDALSMKKALEEALAHRGGQAEGATTRVPTLDAPRAVTSVHAVKTQNTAVLFAAISDWTERTGTLPPHAASALQSRFESLLVPVAKRFGGRKVKVVGGTLLFAISSPTAAVECAMAMQDRLWDARRDGTHELLSARIALSMGEVTLQEGDLFGEPVNIAARVLELTGDGEVAFTDAVYLAMNRSELLADELGAQQLKGIPFAVKVYKVRRGNLPELPPYGTRASGGMPAVSRALHAVTRSALADRRIAAAVVAGVVLLAAVAVALVWRVSRGPFADALQKAQAALSQGNPKEAHRLLAPALAAKPPPPRALALDGRAHIAESEWIPGLEQLRDAARADPSLRPELVQACVQALGVGPAPKKKGCPVRVEAITLLTTLDATEARAELKRISETRGECGRDEATSALRNISATASK